MSGRRPWLAASGVKLIGQVGILMRGGLFLVVGWQHDAHLAGGLQNALMVLGHPPLGLWVLGLVVLGFMAMGLYSLIPTRSRLI